MKKEMEIMTPEERIDAALESVLKVAGSELCFYRKHRLDGMREAMRKIMSDAYIAGTHDNFEAMKKQMKKQFTSTKGN